MKEIAHYCTELYVLLEKPVRMYASIVSSPVFLKKNKQEYMVFNKTYPKLRHRTRHKHRHRTRHHTVMLTPITI